MKSTHLLAGGFAALTAISFTVMDLAHGQAGAPPGDTKRGAQIAAEGTPAGAPGCVSCHGVDGNPDGSGTFPRLFGQPRAYLIKQLQDYTKKTRTSEIMDQVAQTLSASDIADVAAYYAAADEPFPKFPAGDAGLVTLGQSLAQVGSGAKSVPGCNNCHGPGGAGQPPAIPYLAGQFAPYMALELQLWKEGKRRNDGGGQMSSVVHNLTAQDIAAVAAYYQQARKPGSAAQPAAPVK